MWNIGPYSEPLWKKRSLDLEPVIYDIYRKVNITVILREVGRWSTGFRRDELKKQKQKAIPWTSSEHQLQWQHL